LEGAVAFYGFPQRYFGKFQAAKAPILAIYGSADPFINAEMVDQLRRELGESPLAHEVVNLEGAARDFFTERLTPDDTRQPGSVAWQKTLAFLEKNRISPPKRDHAPIL
jgi:dienelactone hydrolase